MFVRQPLTAALMLVFVGLAACTQTDHVEKPKPAGSAALATGDSAVGRILTDRAGRTVYRFDQDTKGASASACTGACMKEWTPVHASGHLAVAGASSVRVATTRGGDGKPQLTVDGWPVYYYDDDEAPGDIHGQAAHDVWWVISSAGKKVTSAPASDAGGASDGSGY
jgi:predicted lipoprotein with Yx(FWY)xxD motif